MEVAKISSKGQITIPVSVRNKLKLRTGDKIVILEENGRFYFENSAMLAFKRAEDAFAGEAQKAGFETEEDISMIFFPSAQTRELARRLTESHQIVVCDYVIEELRLVTERKFPAKRKFLDRFFMELPFELVYTPKELDLNEFPEMRDVKDSPILATAIMEGIDVFLTGDKDFLVLDVETPEILTMKEFLEQY